MQRVVRRMYMEDLSFGSLCRPMRRRYVGVNQHTIVQSLIGRASCNDQMRVLLEEPVHKRIQTLNIKDTSDQ